MLDELGKLLIKLEHVRLPVNERLNCRPVVELGIDAVRLGAPERVNQSTEKL